jgi:hypothetical protein
MKIARAPLPNTGKAYTNQELKALSVQITETLPERAKSSATSQ